MMKNMAWIAIVVGMFAGACQQVRVEGEPEGGPSPTLEAEGEAGEEDVDVATTPTGCAEVSATDGAPAPLTMKDTFFEPTCLAVSSTQEFTFSNQGDLTHNFSIRGTDVSVDVEPGEEVESEDLLSDVELGTHEFFCRFHEQDGMIGTIVIE